MTVCNRAGRNRQPCHLKTTTPKAHTRQPNSVYRLPGSSKETVESDRLSCGLINKRRTQLKQIRGWWKLFDWMLWGHYRTATTVQMASYHITHRCRIVHPATLLCGLMFTLCSPLYLVLLPIQMTQKPSTTVHPSVFLITSAKIIHVAAICIGRHPVPEPLSALSVLLSTPSGKPHLSLELLRPRRGASAH